MFAKMLRLRTTNSANTNLVAFTCVLLGHVAAESESVERNLFATDLYTAIASEKLNDNVVISPAAIQTSMALAFYGAKGKTATEMQQGLRLGSSDPEAVARHYGEFQQSFGQSTNIRLINNIFINENLEFKGKFRDIARRDFSSDVEKADFHPPYNKRTAERINKLIETKTNGKITDVIKPEQLDDRTEGIVVNAITFSSPWQKAFKADKTAKRAFSTGGRQSFRVDTMWTLNHFKYGDLSEYDAKAIELPFQDTDFSMVILLPNKHDGLRELVQQVKGKNLLGILDKAGLHNEKVEVYLPKFAITYGQSMEEPFKKLGVSTMFTREGDFGNLYRMFVSHYINSVNHKASVEFAESGVEQPLENGGIKGLFSSLSNKKFDASHPFIFAIKQRNSIIFMGHIANYAYA